MVLWDQRSSDLKQITARLDTITPRAVSKYTLSTSTLVDIRLGVTTYGVSGSGLLFLIGVLGWARIYLHSQHSSGWSLRFSFNNNMGVYAHKNYNVLLITSSPHPFLLVYPFLLMFTYVYTCLLNFTRVYLRFPLITRVFLFSHV